MTRDGNFDLKRLSRDRTVVCKIVSDRCKMIWCRGGDCAIFELVAGLKSENADGFDPDVLVRRSIDNCRIRLIGDGARQNVSRAAVGVGDMHERQLDLLKRAVVIETKTRELPRAQLIVDMHDGVHFFATVPVGLEAHLGFEQLNPRWQLSLFLLIFFLLFLVSLELSFDCP